MKPRARRRIAVQDDSDSEEASDSGSDTETSIVNGNTANKRKAPPAKRRGRPKKNRIQTGPDGSSDEGSSVQSTLNATNSETNNTQASSTGQEVSDSGEETPDSDYMPVADDIRKPPPTKRRGKPPARISPRKKKNVPNYTLNKPGTSSQNGTASVNHLGSTTQCKRLSTSSAGSKDSTTFRPEHVESLAQKCVYFLLIEDQKKYAIRKKAIVTYVFKDENYSTKFYTAVITRASSILMETFGMELMQLENQKDSYLLISILNRELNVEDYVELTRAKHQHHGLILYLLTVIFMNGNCMTEDELAKALKPLKLDFSSNKSHPIFGDVKKYITVELVKQMYLNYQCMCKDPPRFEITWGLRAKEEVDKKDLLQFACQIMDETTPEKWILQYKDAEQSAGPANI